MSKLVEFIIKRLKERENDWDFPIDAQEGTYYSTLTGSDPPTIEIDWDKLQLEMEAFEAEFNAGIDKPGAG